MDLIAHRTLDAGIDLQSDHPGFNDPIYRARRAELATKAINHRWDQPIPRIDYTPDEVATWKAVWDRMEGLWKAYACKEFLVRTLSKTAFALLPVFDILKQVGECATHIMVHGIIVIALT